MRKHLPFCMMIEMQLQSPLRSSIARLAQFTKKLFLICHPMRPTKEITTNIAKAKVVAYTYATGLEAHEIDRMYMEGAQVKVFDGKPQIDGFNIDNTFNVTKKLISTLVVSVNGSKENVVDAILEIPSEDFDQV